MMRRNAPMPKWRLFLFDGAVVLGLGIGAVTGLIIGATYGGNYAPVFGNFEFLGLRGYETTGYLGGLLGILLAAGVLYGIAEARGYRGSSIAPELGFMIGLTIVSWPLPAFVMLVPHPALQALTIGALSFIGTWIGLRAIGLRLDQYGQHWRKK